MKSQLKQAQQKLLGFAIELKQQKHIDVHW